MRIGIDCRLWSESGVGRYVRNLVYNLAVLDGENEYVLFILSKDKKNVKCQMPASPNRGESNVKCRVADIRWHSIDEQLKFPSILNQENLDLVHFPYFSVPIFYNRPFVVTIHDLILHHFPTGEASTLPLPIYWIKLLGYKFVICQAARRAREVVAVSNATKNEIVDHLGVEPDKVVVTYEGIDHKITNKIQNSKFKKIIGNYLLYVGNAYPHKNLERLLEAFKNVYTLNPTPYTLILVGKEDYFYKRLKFKVRELGLADKVIFLGEASDEELVKLYKNAKALVMPSLMEGFGLPTIEAMANGCLVLCSDIPALREVCKDAAIYFDPNDISSIKQKIKEACLNDLPAGKAGSNHFSKNIREGFERAKMFSWEKMARETQEVYEEVLGMA